MPALYDVVENGVLDVLDVVWEVFGLESDLIIPRFRVFPGVAFLQSFFFGQGEVFLSNGLVVGEGREFRREEFAVFIYSAFLVCIWHLVHMFHDAWYELHVFLFGVLLVEDAVALVSEAYAGEEGGGARSEEHTS